MTRSLFKKISKLLINTLNNTAKRLNFSYRKTVLGSTVSFAGTGDKYQSKTVLPSDEKRFPRAREKRINDLKNQK